MTLPSVFAPLPHRLLAPTLVEHDFIVISAGNQSLIERNDGYPPLPVTGEVRIAHSGNQWQVSFPGWERHCLASGMTLLCQSAEIGIVPGRSSLRLRLVLYRARTLPDGSDQMQHAFATPDDGVLIPAGYLLTGEVVHPQPTPDANHSREWGTGFCGTFHLEYCSTTFGGTIIDDTREEATPEGEIEVPDLT